MTSEDKVIYAIAAIIVLAVVATLLWVAYIVYFEPSAETSRTALLTTTATPTHPPKPTEIPKSVEATPTPIPPTPGLTVTPVPHLALEEWVEWDGLAIAVRRYEVTHECLGHGDGPAEGAKLIYVWVGVRNISEDVIEMPDLWFVHNGKYSDWYGGTVCLYDNGALGNACWKWYGKLYPEVMCEGWELFEVPERMQVEGTLVEVLAHIPGKGIDKVGEWRLEK